MLQEHGIDCQELPDGRYLFSKGKLTLTLRFDQEPNDVDLAAIVYALTTDWLTNLKGTRH